MGNIREAIYGIHQADEIAAKDQWLQNLHPLAKLLVTFGYILTVVSFHKYDLLGTAGMGLYLFVLFYLGEIPFGRALRQLKAILWIVAAVGIANPFLDHQVIGHIGGFALTGGMISMITLMLKGIYAVLASYLLVVSTSIEGICYGLQCLHVPKTFLTVILLIYRYIIVLLKEAERITLAYEMRAPGQKGIHWKAWGSLAGQLLLRSIDRAQVVYESMMLRGYDGTFRLVRKKSGFGVSAGYVAGWMAVFLAFRILPLFEIVGGIFRF
ncbi:MAG TPA: cobalt ECF transporter T component CbiQ [Candidatus Anaerostipes excrementavium]|uniref:Cobalt ECF transporter T component CbiQ n=1 Tax=Candidatus Anaerostipes excrementavium TaxID=2838463 RepID=A0A9D1WWD3_9FIRM|nr:cobalt ECF transporter T component CbiQ [uncultured Anaerostipes sp.]HIX67265.1 cobalt ECF transporter T component CbiQ [Candidatus Anaerostipes excrementavium]